MDPITALAEKLARHPELRWTRGDDWMQVDAPSPTGFAVEFRHEGDEWTVYLGSGGWHQHFDDSAEALELIAWCYSGDARMRETYRGKILQKSALEGLVNGSWQSVSLTGYLAFFWRTKTEVVLQNPNILP